MSEITSFGIDTMQQAPIPELTQTEAATSLKEAFGQAIDHFVTQEATQQGLNLVTEGYRQVNEAIGNLDLPKLDNISLHSLWNMYLNLYPSFTNVGLMDRGVVCFTAFAAVLFASGASDVITNKHLGAKACIALGVAPIVGAHVGSMLTQYF